MKLEANVEIKALDIKDTETTVLVDADYVDASPSAVRECVADKLWDKYGRPFNTDEFEVTNIGDVVADLAFDEFENKTQYADA